MSLRYYANAPATTLSAGITNSAISLTVTSATGLPVSYPYTLIIDRGEVTEEIIEVTGGAGTNLTVTRAVDDTTAFAHDAGATVEHGISARDVREANTHVNSSSAVHGLAGDVVGDTDVQALSNKDLTDPSNTFPSTQVDTTSAQTLTNKTISADSNTLSGLPADSFVVTDASGNVDGAAAAKAIPTGAVVGDSDTQTLTGKTLSADSNTISGVAASSFVLSDASGNVDGSAAQKAIPSGAVVGTSDSQTLTNKTLTSPTINGTPNMRVKVQSGVVAMSTSGSSNTSAGVTFAQAFAGTPAVVCTATGTSQFYCTTSSVSGSGFTLTATQRDNSSVTTSFSVYWVAVLP
jgi:hypothetical protein